MAVRHSCGTAIGLGVMVEVVCVVGRVVVGVVVDWVEVFGVVVEGVVVGVVDAGWLVADVM